MKQALPAGGIALPHQVDRLVATANLPAGKTVTTSLQFTEARSVRPGTSRALRVRHVPEIDGRGCEITGATLAALEAYEGALEASLSWRSGAIEQLDVALQAAPTFVMAHVLRAWLLLSGRDLERIRSARPVLARAASLPVNERERLHLSAIRAVLDDDYERAKRRLDDILRVHPHDVLALQVAHSLDYLTGDINCLRDRVPSVLAEWSSDMPGYHALLAMSAFSLEECGEYERAEQAALEALALDPGDARAHHVMAHVFEMTDRAAEGIRWMNAHKAGWAAGTIVAVHCWWHVALFHVALGQCERALAIYDRYIRPGRSSELSDLIDSSALLWRIDLLGGDSGRRWSELADGWAPRIDDSFCSFNDVHAMLSFVGARDWTRAQRLERVLARSHALPTRHGETTRHLGLPACRALVAFGRGNDALAVSLLASLPAFAQRLGGSHAQRDVLHLTLSRAIERMRRPPRQQRVPPQYIAARA